MKCTDDFWIGMYVATGVCAAAALLIILLVTSCK